MAPFTDYYRILELAPSATLDQIKQSYRRLARQHHPDVAGTQATEHFQRILEAYQVLTDPSRRREFDRLYQSQRSSSDPAPAYTRVSAQDPRVVVKAQPQDELNEGQRQDLEERIRQVKQSIKQRKWMNAVHEAEALIHRFPRIPEAIHIVAVAYQRLGSEFLYRGETRSAEFYLQKALETEPSNREILFEVRRDLSRIRHFS